MKKIFLKSLMVAAVVCLPVLNSWAQTEIRTVDDLRNIKNDLTGSYVLMNDIDFATVTDWIPIGLENLPAGNTVNDDYNFTGTFDGQNHKLSNITVNRPDLGFMSALFTKLGKSGAGSVAVKNLVLENVNITGGNCTGAVSGTAFAAAAGTTVTIQNVYVSGKITGAGEVGGITGRVNNNNPTNINNCSVNAVISGTDLNTASQGLGVNAQGVASNTSGKVNIGGIVGSAFNGQYVTIQNCLVQGQISATSAAGNELNTGGLIGHANNVNATIYLNNSVVAAKLTGGSLNAFWGNNANHNGNGNATMLVTSCYARDDAGLTNQEDGTLVPLADLQTQSLYDALDWDFETIWKMDEGKFPIFQWQEYGAANIVATKAGQLWNVAGLDNGIEVTASKPFSLAVYNVTGQLLYNSQANGNANVSLNKGVYILKVNCDGVEGIKKVMVK